MDKTATYWVAIFNAETWQEFADAGARVSGFPKKKWGTVQKIKPGDLLLCYLVRAARWVGMLEVISEPFLSSERIWKSDLFAARIRVKPRVLLRPENGIPVLSMRGQLEAFRHLSDQNRWGVIFRTAPYRWRANDGKYVAAALKRAAEHPVAYALEPKELMPRPDRKGRTGSHG